METTRRGFLGGAFGVFAGLMAVRLPASGGEVPTVPTPDTEILIEGPEMARLVGPGEAIAGEGMVTWPGKLFQAAYEVNKRLTGQEDPYGFERVGNYVEAACIDEAVWEDREWNPFEVVNLEPGQCPEFPLDLITPGDPQEIIAVSQPKCGYVPQRHVGGDYVLVPTYDIGNAVDWKLNYTLDNRADVIGRALQLYTEGFRKKMFMDRWGTVLAAGGNPEFGAKNLPQLVKIAQKKYEKYRKPWEPEDEQKWTDVVISPEQYDELKNKDFKKDVPPDIEGATIHVFDELGINQELWQFYQAYINTAPGELKKRDFAIFIDNRRNDTFVTVRRQGIVTFIDPSLHRQRRSGIYGWGEVGHVTLNDQNVAIGTI